MVNYSEVQLTTFRDRYAWGDERYPHEAWQRVAAAVALREAPDQVDYWTARFFDLQDKERYVPGGRIMAAMGTGTGVTAQNCYVIPSPHDSRKGIMESLTQWIEIQSKGGGVGVNLSSLRPAGARVEGVNGTSSGPVNWAQLFAFVTSDIIIQGGSRRGAAMIMLDVSHPDVFSFIHAKEVPGKLEGCNMSVCISDAFMEAVAADKPWDLVFDGKVYETVQARQIWNEVCEAAWKSAEPGIYFMDRANKEANSGYFETLIATNPCLAAGTLVSTSEGLRPVESVREGDGIATVHGLGTVETVEAHASIPVFMVRFSDGAELRATAAHRFHALHRRAGRSANASERFSKIRVDELSIGDVVRVAPMAMPNFPVPDLPPTLSEREYGLQLGLLLGGWPTAELASDRSLATSTTVSTADGWNAALRRLMGRMGEDEDFNRSADEWAQGESGLSSVANASALEPEYLHTKRIPEVYFRTNERFLAGLVDGLFSSAGDFNLSSNSPDLLFTSASRDLASDLRRVLLMFGIHARVDSDGSSDGAIDDGGTRSGREKHELRVSGAGLRTFWERIGLSEPSKAAKLAEALNEGSLPEDTWSTTVVSIEADGEADVYDLYEPTTDTWIADGIVSQGCGEQPLGPYGACLLGSFNLKAFLKDGNDGRYFDWNEFIQFIPDAVRFNDNVVDLSSYPLLECTQSQHDIRRMGLGIMGLADVLIELKLRYGSKEAIDFTEQVFSVLKNTAYWASAKLSSERGPFPKFSKEFLTRPFVQTLQPHVREAIEAHGIRNCYLLTQAPTGTTAQLVGVNSGIEPYFAFKTFRKDRLGSYWVMTEWAEEYESDSRPAYLVTADEVTPEEHVLMQAAAQRHNDSSISKTANLPESATVEDVKRLYDLAYQAGLKSLSVYRNNSRSVQVLNRAEDVEKTTVDAGAVQTTPSPMRRKLPQDRQAVTHKFMVGDQEGYLTIGLFDDGSPGEVFTRVSKQGSTVSGLMDTVSLLLSYCLQYGVPLDVLVEKITGTSFEPAGRTTTKGVPYAQSIPDYMLRWMDFKFLGGSTSTMADLAQEVTGTTTGEICSRCGSMMRRQEGCVGCPGCGWEKCG